MEKVLNFNCFMTILFTYSNFLSDFILTFAAVELVSGYKTFQQSHQPERLNEKTPFRKAQDYNICISCFPIDLRHFGNAYSIKTIVPTKKSNKNNQQILLNWRCDSLNSTR